MCCGGVRRRRNPSSRLRQRAARVVADTEPVTGSPARGRTRLPRHASPATPAPPYVLHGACPPPLVANPEPAAARAERVCHEGGPGLSTRWNRAARGVRELVGAAYEQVGAHIAQTHLRLTAEAGHRSQPPVNLLPEGLHEPLSWSRPPRRRTWVVDEGGTRLAAGSRCWWERRTSRWALTSRKHTYD